MTPLTHHSILIVGASRGLGHAMAAEFLQHGWNVIGTVRNIQHPTPLHQLARDNPGRVRLETLDVCDDEQLAALDHRLSGSRLEMLIVNAGITNRDP